MLHLNPCFLEVKSGSISKWEKNVNSPNVIQFFALCEILGIDNINDTFGIAIEENLFAQLNEEGKDNVQLISLNKKYAPIQIKPEMELRTFGKVVK